MPSQAWTRPSRQRRSQCSGALQAGVAENASAALHALLELDGEPDEGCYGEIECGEAAMGEGDVDGALRLALIPVLAGGDDGKSGRQSACRLCVCKVKEAVARVGHVVAAQDEALDVGWR